MKKDLIRKKDIVRLIKRFYPQRRPIKIFEDEPAEYLDDEVLYYSDNLGQVTINPCEALVAQTVKICLKIMVGEEEVKPGAAIKVHVKDYRMEVDNSYGYTHLLQGDVNWPLMVEKLKKVGYDNYLIVELPLYRYFPEKMFFDTSTSLDRIIE